MYNFNFICRESKQNRHGLAPIELSIIINSKRTYVTLPYKCNAEEFKKKMTSRRNNDVLEYTSNIRIKLNKYINDLIASDVPVTADTLKEYFINGGTKSFTLSALREEFLKYYKRKNECGQVTDNVVRKYELAYDKLVAFIGKDIEVSAVNCITLENFKCELLKQFEDTTVAHILCKIKTMFTYAVNNGKLKLNPFVNVKIEKNTKEVVKLDNDEVEIIKHKAFAGRLDKVRDLFLFQCYTGLSFCDMSALVQSDIQFEDGMHFVRKTRQKTKVVFFTVLNDDAMSILSKYNYQLPLLSNQKYNSYLKEIGDICNIGKELHSHLARHTCATRLLNDGMPLEIVAKVLGHTNIRQTQHYAKLLDRSVLSAFKKLG